MSAQDHAAAVLAQLAASGSPALIVFDGKVPEPPEVPVLPTPPYLLVRFTFRSQGADVRPDASDLTFRSVALECTARVYSVTANARAARALVNRVSVALLDWTPTVASRSCSPMRHIDSFEAPPDERTGTTYFEVVDDYRFTSYPA